MLKNDIKSFQEFSTILSIGFNSNFKGSELLRQVAQNFDGSLYIGL